MNKPPKGDCYRYILNLVLTLKDTSNKSKNSNNEEHVNVYLTSGDDESHIFDNWNIIPKMNDKKSWKTIS